jgi:hypothetical protein
METTKRIFKLILITVILAYFSSGLIIFLFQKKFIYHPSQQTTINEKEIVINSGDVELFGWLINPGKDSAIIYFGGNAEYIENHIDTFKRRLPNYTIYFINYRGYGKSGGKPSETDILNDTLAVYDYIKNKHHSISAIGRSLGSGVANFLGSKRKLDKIVLLTPYDSMVDIAKERFWFLPISLLATERYMSKTYAQDVTANVLIFIAEDDKTISIKRSLALEENYKKTKPTKIIIKDTNHYTITYSLQYKEELERFFSN